MTDVEPTPDNHRPGPEATNPSGIDWLTDSQAQIDRNEFNTRIDWIVDTFRALHDDGVVFEITDEGLTADPRFVVSKHPSEIANKLGTIDVMFDTLDGSLARKDGKSWGYVALVAALPELVEEATEDSPPASAS